MPDPITHISAALLTARHIKKVREYKALFLFSTMAPDIDGLIAIIYIAFNNPVAMARNEMAAIFNAFHPSFSASFLFLPFFAFLVMLFFKAVKRSWTPPGLKDGFIIVTGAIVLHLSLDLLMTGNRPFWPFPFEAGLGVIPYTPFAAFITPAIALGILFVDWLVFRKK